MTEGRTEGRRVPFGNMRFRVEVDGGQPTGALGVVFPEARLDVRGRKPRYGNVILERGLTRSRDWYDWWDAARRARRPPTRSVRVVLLGPDGEDVSGWQFTQAAPIAYRLSPLHALGNEVVVETLELAIRDFAMIGDAPMAAAPAPRPKRKSHARRR